MSRLGRGVLVSIAIVALLGCSKSGGDQAADAPALSAPAAPAGSADASAAAAAKKEEDAPRAFRGKYSLTPAAIYIPDAKDYAKVKQAKDDPSKHVGEGELTLSVAPDGKVTGTIDSGPAAPAILDGAALGEEVRGNVRRKDPSDDGLTGTFHGTIAAGKLEGALSLADADAAIVREGKLSLARN